MLSGPGCTSKGFHCLPDCLSTSFSTNSPSAFAVLESTPPDAGSSLDDASAMIGRGRRKAAGLQDEIRRLPAEVLRACDTHTPVSAEFRRNGVLRQLRLDRHARAHSSTRNPCEPTAPNLVAGRDAETDCCASRNKGRTLPEAVPLGRQQLVEVQLAIDRSAGLVEAGYDPMLLTGLLDRHRRKSTFLARHARSVRPIRPSWSCGQQFLDAGHPLLDAGHPVFNAGHSFAKCANFGPEHVNFSLDTSEIFAHVAAKLTDLAAN